LQAIATTHSEGRGCHYPYYTGLVYIVQQNHVNNGFVRNRPNSRVRFPIHNNKNGFYVVSQTTRQRYTEFAAPSAAARSRVWFAVVPWHYANYQ